MVSSEQISFAKCFGCVMLFMAWISWVVVFKDTFYPKRTQCCFLLIDALLAGFYVAFVSTKVGFKYIYEEYRVVSNE